MSQQQDVLPVLRERFPLGARWVAQVRAQVQHEPHEYTLILAHQGLRGAIVGRTNALVGDGVRHHLIEMLFPETGGTSKKLTIAQARALGYGLDLAAREYSQDGDVHGISFLTTLDAAVYDGLVQVALELGGQLKIGGNVNEPAVVEEPKGAQASAGEPAGTAVPADVAEQVDEGMTELPETEAAWAVVMAHRETLAQVLPEAPSSVTVTFAVNGFNTMMTMRDTNEATLWARYKRFMDYIASKPYVQRLNKYGEPIVYLPNGGAPQTPGSAPQEPTRVEAPGRTQSAQQDQTPTQPSRNAPGRSAPARGDSTASAGDENVKSGCTELKEVSVDAKGVVSFTLDKFRWPFKDSRGAEVVAGLFDAQLDISDADLQPGALLDAAKEWNSRVYVHWVKPGKYYDVERVSFDQ